MDDVVGAGKSAWKIVYKINNEIWATSACANVCAIEEEEEEERTNKPRKKVEQSIIKIFSRV